MSAADQLTLRESEYKRALATLEAALPAVLLWGDSVSADVERRLGVVPSDPRRYDEVEYATALDVVGLVKEAVRRMREAER